MSILRKLVGKFFEVLDAERVSTFQTMYYFLFITAALVLIFVPQAHVAGLSATLSKFHYSAWLAVNLICPVLTLIGRRLTLRASHVDPDEPNPAYGAAILQLVGDFGVWSCINIYIASFILAGTWVQEFTCFIFLVMGVLGGGMFTVRSVRRLVGIERRNRRENTECQETT
jgi:hypothetical protein